MSRKSKSGKKAQSTKVQTSSTKKDSSALQRLTSEHVVDEVTPPADAPRGDTAVAGSSHTQDKNLVKYSTSSDSQASISSVKVNPSSRKSSSSSSQSVPLASSGSQSSTSSAKRNPSPRKQDTAVTAGSSRPPFKNVVKSSATFGIQSILSAARTIPPPKKDVRKSSTTSPGKQVTGVTVRSSLSQGIDVKSSTPSGRRKSSSSDKINPSPKNPSSAASSPLSSTDASHGNQSSISLAKMNPSPKKPLSTSSSQSASLSSKVDQSRAKMTSSSSSKSIIAVEKSTKEEALEKAVHALSIKEQLFAKKDSPSKESSSSSKAQSDVLAESRLTSASLSSILQAIPSRERDRYGAIPKIRQDSAKKESAKKEAPKEAARAIKKQPFAKKDSPSKDCSSSSNVQSDVLAESSLNTASLPPSTSTELIPTQALPSRESGIPKMRQDSAKKEKFNITKQPIEENPVSTDTSELKVPQLPTKMVNIRIPAHLANQLFSYEQRCEILRRVGTSIDVLPVPDSTDDSKDVEKSNAHSESLRDKPAARILNDPELAPLFKKLNNLSKLNGLRKRRNQRLRKVDKRVIVGRYIEGIRHRQLPCPHMWDNPIYPVVPDEKLTDNHIRLFKLYFAFPPYHQIHKLEICHVQRVLEPPITDIVRQYNFDGSCIMKWEIRFKCDLDSSYSSRLEYHLKQIAPSMVKNTYVNHLMQEFFSCLYVMRCNLDHDKQIISRSALKSTETLVYGL